MKLCLADNSRDALITQSHKTAAAVAALLLTSCHTLMNQSPNPTDVGCSQVNNVVQVKVALQGNDVVVDPDTTPPVWPCDKIVWDSPDGPVDIEFNNVGKNLQNKDGTLKPGNPVDVDKNNDKLKCDDKKLCEWIIPHPTHKRFPAGQYTYMAIVKDKADPNNRNKDKKSDPEVDIRE